MAHREVMMIEITEVLRSAAPGQAIGRSRQLWLDPESVT
jgi:hypothetical protein